MRTITVIYDGTVYTFKWLKALLVIKSRLRKLGYKLDLLPICLNRHTSNNDILKRIDGKAFDIVFLAFHHSTSELGKCSTNERCNIVKEVKEHCNYLVWLDTADSTGTCLFDVMPYVDRYLKKQLLIDFSDYARPVWGNRTYCEYYHNNGMYVGPQPEEREYPTLDIKYSDKLGVSWNMLLSDLFASGLCSRLFFGSFAKRSFKTTPFKKRDIDVHFRGTVSKGVVGLQRKLTLDNLMLNKKIKTPDYSCDNRGKLYQIEVSNSKSVVSPYGWGEVCFRDFETFSYGAILIKPSMQHCKTYPNIYKEYETYVPIKWDFSDFDDILEEIKKGSYEDIALNGGKQYDWFRSKEGLDDFAKHLIAELKLN